MKTTKRLYEIVNDTCVEYMLIVATSEEKAIKYAEKYSEICDPEYAIGNINKSIEVSNKEKLGLFRIMHSGVGEFSSI